MNSMPTDSLDFLKLVIHRLALCDVLEPNVAVFRLVKSKLLYNTSKMSHMNEYTTDLSQSSSQLVTKYTGGQNFWHSSHIMLILDQLTWHIALGLLVFANYRIYVLVTQIINARCVTQVNNHEV